MAYVVVGAGSLGQAFTGLLARAGQSVTLLATPRTASRLLASGGIRLRGAVLVALKVGANGIQVITEPSDIPDGATVLFTTKGHDLPAAIESVRSAADRRVAWAGGVQNGIVKDDLLRAAFGPERVVGAVTILGAGRQEDGTVQVTSLGQTYFGEFDGQLSERVTRTADTFQAAGMPTQARQDIASVLWSKACNATGVFGIAVLARASSDRLFSNPHLFRAYLGLVRETAEVAAAYGVRVGNFTGFPTIQTFAEGDEDALVAQISPQPGPPTGPPSYASMTQDLLAGLPLEVDAVFGDIVERADRKNLPVPRLRLARDVIRGLDPGQPTCSATS